MSKESEIPEDKLKAYEKLVATIPEVERRGATMPYTSCNRLGKPLFEDEFVNDS